MNNKDLDNFIGKLGSLYPAFNRAFGCHGIASLTSTAIGPNLVDFYASEPGGVLLDTEDIKEICVALGALAVKLKEIKDK